MLNVHDLERRWLKYKIRSYIPISILLVTVIGISITAFSYFNSTDTLISENTIQQKETSLVNSTIKEKETSVSLSVPENTEESPVAEKTLILKPSLRFMDNIEEGLNPYLEDENTDDLKLDLQKQYQQNEDIKYTTNKVDNFPDVPDKGTLSITTKKNESDLKDVIRRFKQNKNPALSLFIAKRYYELGKYQKSYNYALMTNEIDKSIDESWILFSKSLVKLGQHELAVVTLKSYLKTSKSSQAEILLRKIESGSFK